MWAVLLRENGEQLGLVWTTISSNYFSLNDLNPLMAIKKRKVFICYAREDKHNALRLFEDLKARGAEAWIDEKNLRAGQDWEMEIRRSIKESDFFISVLSSKSVNKRGFVNKEIKLALSVLDEFPKGSIFFIPVRLDECIPNNERIKEIHRVDMFPDWEVGIKRLCLDMDLIVEIDENEEAAPLKSQEMIPSGSRKRLQITLSKQSLDRINEMSHTLGHSRTEIASNAISFYGWTIKTVSDGGNIRVHKGGQVMDVLVPGL